jgi:hypothetical protein
MGRRDRAGCKARLRYRAPGYELALAPNELDAAEFAQLVAEARQQAAAGDHGRALSLLDTALFLWRGDALAEFDIAALGAEGDVARLADLRLIAIEQRAGATLSLGRGREVSPELEDLVTRYPERERLAVLLMRALYVTGRQTEALTVYRRLRRVLVEELGVEPSEPTRAVHRQLLTHDAALLPPAVSRPTNLPRRGTRFVGRGQELDAVATALREGPLVTLSGPGGSASPGWLSRWRRANVPGSPTASGSASSRRSPAAPRSGTRWRPPWGCSGGTGCRSRRR